MTARNVIDFNRAREAIESDNIRLRQEIIRGMHREVANSAPHEASVASVFVEMKPNGSIRFKALNVEPSQIDAFLNGFRDIEARLLEHKFKTIALAR